MAPAAVVPLRDPFDMAPGESRFGVETLERGALAFTALPRPGIEWIESPERSFGLTGNRW